MRSSSSQKRRFICSPIFALGLYGVAFTAAIVSGDRLTSRLLRIVSGRHETQ